MNTEEIKSLIAAKIAGQGYQVDIGGALPEVLNAIIDMVSDLPAPLPVVEITEEEMNSALDVDRFNQILYAGLLKFNNRLYVPSSSTLDFIPQYDLPAKLLFINYVQFEDGALASFEGILLSSGDGEYFIEYAEM